MNRKLAVELIDRVFVYTGQRIRIEFKFQAEYDRLAAFVNTLRQTRPSEQEVG